MMSRFYHPQPWAALHSPFVLPDDVFRHAVTVLRLNIGDGFVLFDGEGRQANAVLSAVEKKTAQAHITSVEMRGVESPLHITLAQCLSSSDKMDWTIEKAVELGVSRIVPLFSTRSQIKLTPERAAKKFEHWQRIIVAACAQCERNVLPELDAPVALSKFLTTAKNSADYKLTLHPRDARPFKSLAPPESGQRIVLLIGPESGLDSSEVAAAQAAQFTSTLLGARILRTESAGLAAIAALQTLWGDF